MVNLNELNRFDWDFFLSTHTFLKTHIFLLWKLIYIKPNLLTHYLPSPENHSLKGDYKPKGQSKWAKLMKAEEKVLSKSLHFEKSKIG